MKKPRVGQDITVNHDEEGNLVDQRKTKITGVYTDGRVEIDGVTALEVKWTDEDGWETDYENSPVG